MAGALVVIGRAWKLVNTDVLLIVLLILPIMVIKAQQTVENLHSDGTIFLANTENELVVFEELGSTPDIVSFRTITVGKACAHAYEESTLRLSCHGGREFSKITLQTSENLRVLADHLVKAVVDLANIFNQKGKYWQRVVVHTSRNHLWELLLVMINLGWLLKPFELALDFPVNPSRF